jgi:hypothetical protein
VSNHDLPATYQDRAHTSQLDYRYSDSITDLKKDIERITGKTAQKKEKEVKHYSQEDIDFAKKEYHDLGSSFQRMKAIYSLKMTEKQFLKMIGEL